MLAEAGELSLQVRQLGGACGVLLEQLAAAASRQPGPPMGCLQALVTSVQMAAEQRLRLQPDPLFPWTAQLAAAIRAGVDFEPAQPPATLQLPSCAGDGSTAASPAAGSQRRSTRRPHQAYPGNITKTLRLEPRIGAKIGAKKGPRRTEMGGGRPVRASSLL